MEAKSSSFRALRHRNYRLLFTGQLVSMIGTWMQTVAQGWLVYRLSHSPALLGLVAFAGLAPSFLLGTLGGVVADRMDARKLAIITQSVLLLQAGVLGVLTLTNHIGIPHVMILAVVMGVANAFDLPAGQVLVGRAVPREDLPNAIALNSSLFHGSRILGPSLAGLVVASSGEGWCFLLNAVSYLAALAALSMLRLPTREVTSNRGSLLAEMIEGLRFVKEMPELRWLFLLLALSTFLAMPFTVLLPAVVKDVLKAGPRELGWIMASSGLGATLGALWLASKREHRGLLRTLLMALGGLAFLLPLFAASHNPWLSMALILPVGFCMVSVNTSNNTLVQMEVPDRLRGRVLSLHATVFMGAMPLGSLVAGFLAQHIGVPWALALGGIGCGVVILTVGPRLWAR
ncbi:MAG: MFS transporter [Holophaga sp.]|nr:MFS transporter [Holophaga sp.]